MFRKKIKRFIAFFTIVSLLTTSIIVVTPKIVKAEETMTAPTLPEITFNDFGDIDGTYGYNGDLALDVNSATGFANKSFVGTVNFTSQMSTAINFAGKESSWEGVKLVTMGDSQVYFAEAYDKFDAIPIDVDVFPLNTNVDIKLSFEVTNLDEDGTEDDVRFWLHIEGVLYKDAPIVEVVDYAKYLGNYLGIYSDNEQSSVKISSKEKENMELAAPTLPEITFTDFGDIDGTYGYNGDLALDVNSATGFANKSFVGTVNFTSQMSTAINFAGKESSWEGVKLVTMGDSQVYFAEAYDKFDAIPIDVDVFPLNTNVDIKLSFEVTNLDEDGTEDDVRFWLYIEGVLYKDAPIVEVVDYAKHLGNYLGIYSDNEQSSVTVVSIPSQIPGEDTTKPLAPTLPEITFNDFGKIDGTYGYNGDLALDVNSATGFANKSFVGTVNFTSQTSTAINFAGKESAWEGVKLVTMGDSQVYFAEAYDRFAAVPIDVEVFPTNTDVDIKLSFEVTNLDEDGAEDDVRFWLHIEGVLYKDASIIEVIDYAKYLGNYLGIYSDNEQSSVTVVSIPSQIPGEDTTKPVAPTFPEVTFGNFGIEDGKYGYNGDLATSGILKDGFANKSFVGTVNFTSQMSTAINFAGKESPWEGVRLVTMGDGQVYFAEAYDYFAAVPIDVEVFPTNTDVDIKLSFEVTNLDEDGAEDDVRFWLHIEGVLYKDAPIVEVIDYAKHLGNYLGIYSDSNNSSVIIRSNNKNSAVEKVDFSIMGFTDDWAQILASGQSSYSDSINVSNNIPYTGDCSSTEFYGCLGIILLMISGGILYIKKRGMWI